MRITHARWGSGFAYVKPLACINFPTCNVHEAGISTLLAKGAVGMMIMLAIRIAMPTMTRAMEGYLWASGAVSAIAGAARFASINAGMSVRIMTNSSVESTMAR